MVVITVEEARRAVEYCKHVLMDASKTYRELAGLYDALIKEPARLSEILPKIVSREIDADALSGRVFSCIEYMLKPPWVPIVPPK